MSILIYHQPKPVDLAGNHLFFRIKGTDYILKEGSASFMAIRSIEDSSEGQNFSISCMGQTHKIYFANTIPWANRPLDADLVIKAGEAAAKAANVFLAYPPIADYYEIIEGGNDLLFKARNIDDKYNLSANFDALPWDERHLDKIWVAHIQDAVNPEIRDNYEIKCRLFVENLSAKGTFNQLPEFALNIDNDQIAEFEIGEILKRRFRQFFDLPDFVMNAPAKAKVSTMEYRLEFREVSGSTQLDKSSLGPLRVIKGKVNTADHPGFDLRNHLSSNKRFLTNQPERHYTWLGAKHYLYYMHTQPGSSNLLKLKLEVLHTGSNEPYVSEIALQAISQDEVMLIPVSDLVDQLEINGNPYECRVSVIGSEGKTIAGVQTYHYLPKRLHARAFLFQNRMGGFDTVTTQQQENTFKVDKDENRRVLTQGYSRYVGSLSSDEASLSDTFSAETGPIPAATADHFKEMAGSGVVFLQTADRFIRIWIMKGSFKLADEGDELHNVKFKYKSAFEGDIINTQLKLPEAQHQDYSSEYLDSDYQ